MMEPISRIAAGGPWRYRSCLTFANSPVIAVGDARVSTDIRGVIETGSAVVATNSPNNHRSQLHTKMAPC